MRHDPSERNEINRELDELEDAYADAFADKVDVRSLANVWERIKFLRQETEDRGNGDAGSNASTQNISYGKQPCDLT